ncbi:replicative DNA helicase [Pelagibacteraceae bacterium]|jgi:replicative DNA helicase|nr:replicative DNA helicase [Pelagibacteraceae bacterium]|tara:strand:+ start:3016 stop:4443 length:1428 start_codon:yes stop_codon:yes gene_type:complete
MEKAKLSLTSSGENKLPSNIEAEQSLIGSILVNNDIIDEISNIVNASKFFDPIHRKIYEVIENLNNKGMIANPITLKNYFENDSGLIEVGGVDYLVKLTRFSSSIKQAIDYAKIIHEMYVKRELIFISDGIEDQAKDDQTEKTGENIIEDAEKSLFDLAERGNFSQTFMKFNQAVDQTIEMATLAMKSDHGIIGVPTGLRDLDQKLGGMHKSDLIIIAGRPSMGKTALATNIAFYAAKNMQENNEKGSVAFFSLEMSSEQLSTRILSEQARISSHEIRTGKASEETLNRYIETSRNIYDLPLYIDETPAIAISTLSNRARRIKRLFGLKLIVVDYIQLMKTNTNRMDGRVQEISEITQGLKALAKELNVPVVALSQLSRAVEQRDDKKPQLSDLRESGSIEQDADVVIFVYREQYYLERKKPKEGSIEFAEWQSKMSEIHGGAELILGKHRHGSTGVVHVEFEGEFTKFKDLPRN